MLAGLHAPGQNHDRRKRGYPRSYRTDAALLRRRKSALKQADGQTRITLTGDAELAGRDISVPGDPSSAAFLIAAALIVPGSRITIRNVLVNPTRTGFFKTVEEMGADIKYENERDESGEPVADIQVSAGPLSGISVPPERAPSMIDEYPVLSVVAAFAQAKDAWRGLASSGSRKATGWHQPPRDWPPVVSTTALRAMR